MNDRDTAIRRAAALRAKAASTGYDGEAEACLAKADDLIARWAINETELGPTRADHVIDRVFSCQGTYRRERLGLLAGLARAHGCFSVMNAIYRRKPGGGHTASYPGHGTIYGREASVDAVLDLWALLDLQMVRLTAGVPGGITARRSFMTGFTARVLDRVDAAVARAAARPDGGGLLPAIRSDLDAATEAAGRFDVTERRVRLDPHAVAAGATAGDRADIGAHRLPEGRPALGAGR